METSRDEILMNFMAATGTEDFGRAFQLLESTDWNFQNALSLYHATDDDHPDPNQILANDFKPASNPFDLLQSSSTSTTTQNSTPMPGKIAVKIKNKHNNRLFERYYDPKTKVVEVRKEASDYFNIPFEVAVWNCSAIDDDDLSSTGKQFLSLEIENIIADLERSDHTENRFTNVVDLGVRGSGMGSHDAAAMIISSDDEDGDVKFVSASEGDVRSKSTPKRSNCGLLPEDANFNTIPEAINYQVAQIRLRFGDKQKIPDFIIGELSDCLCHTISITGETEPWKSMGVLPSELRKPTVIFINNDESTANNIFMNNILFHDVILNQLNSCAVWCWDVTAATNRSRMLGWLDQYFEAPTMATYVAGRDRHLSPRVKFSKLSPQDFPLMIVITQDPESKTKALIHEIIKSSTDVQTVMETLLTATSIMDTCKEALLEDENQRKERERLRAAQQSEYEQSLNRDIQARQAQEEKASKEKEKADLEQAIENQKEVDKNSAESRIEQADERLKSVGISEQIVFRIRTPGGNFTRSFGNNEDVGILFSWACTLGYFDCSVNCAFPRIQFSNHKGEQLKELNLGKQVALILEDLSVKNDSEEDDDDDDDSSDDE